MGCSISKRQTSSADNLVCSSCRKNIFNFNAFQLACQGSLCYTSSWKDIQKANQQGCQWCDLMYAETDRVLRMLSDESEGTQESVRQICHYKFLVNLSIRDKDSISGYTYDISEAGQTTHTEGQSLLISFTSASDGKALHFLSVPISTASEDPAARYIPIRPLVYQMSSVDTFQLARAEVHACVHGEKGHENCPGYKTPVLPTRVIDCENLEFPKLMINTSGIEAPYIALSYVWGEDQPQKTSTLNIDRYVTTGMEMRQIPRTVQDAIHVTRSLHVRYLWVDSYCILQDSTADKACEIRNMRRIFQQAYVTIIAAKSPKVSAGFLNDCPRPEMTYVVPFFGPGGSKDLGTMTLSLPTAFSVYDPSKEPTNSRGWCLEERILTPRALIYASNTLQFLCQKGLLNTGHSATNAKVSGVDRLAPQFFWKSHNSPSLPPDDKTIDELTKLWYRVLYDYTQRGLTSPPDRLKAIAGVAEEFHYRFRNSRYMAGIWEHNLLGGLLWFKVLQDLLPTPSVYRAPSWSWASIDGLICHRNSLIKPGETCCVIVECHVELVREDSPFGEVKGGFLKVRGRLVDLWWNSSRCRVYGPKQGGRKSAIIGSCNVDRLEDVNGHWREENYSLEDEALAEEEILAEDEAEHVWALPLTVRPPKRGYINRRASHSLEVNGILLQVVNCSEPHIKGKCFRRVGLFDLPMQLEVQTMLEAAKENTITIV